MTSVRRISVVVAIAFALTTTLMVTMTAPAAADDWPDDCDDDFVQPATGVFAGQLDSAADADAIEFELDRGDAVTVGALTEPDRGVLRIDASVRSNTGGIVVRETALEPGVQLRSGDRSTGPGDPIRAEIRGNATGANSTWQLRATEDASVCVVVSRADGSFPAGWELSLNENATERNPLSRASVEAGLTARDREIDRLRDTVREQNRTIERLRSQLDNGSVRIDVTVEPANDSAAFVAGGAALVTVESDDVPVTDVVVTSGGTFTTPNADGRVTIPLEAAGRHRLGFTYRQATETVDLTVEAATTTETTDATPTPTPTDRPTTEPGTATTAGPTETTATTGPGFGALAALLAALAALILLARRGD